VDIQHQQVIQQELTSLCPHVTFRAFLKWFRVRRVLGFCKQDTDRG